MTASSLDSVKFKLTRQGMEEPVLIEALSFPTICTPLPPMMKLDNYVFE